MRIQSGWPMGMRPNGGPIPRAWPAAGFPRVIQHGTDKSGTKPSQNQAEGKDRDDEGHEKLLRREQMLALWPELSLARSHTGEGRGLAGRAAPL